MGSLAAIASSITVGFDSPSLEQLALDNLSLADATRLSNFARCTQSNMVAMSSPRSLQKLEFLVSSVADSRLVRESVPEDHNRLIQTISAATDSTKWGEINKSHFTKMQPLHPLQNGPALCFLSERDRQRSQWLGFCYDFFQEPWEAMQLFDLELLKAKVGAAKPSALNRLQRSFMSSEVATVRKDTTVLVALFLQHMIMALADYMDAHLDDYVSNSVSGIAIHRNCADTSTNVP